MKLNITSESGAGSGFFLPSQPTCHQPDDRASERLERIIAARNAALGLPPHPEPPQQDHHCGIWRSGKLAAETMIRQQLAFQLVDPRPADYSDARLDSLLDRLLLVADMIVRGTEPLSDYTIAKKPFAGDGWSFHVPREERPRRRLPLKQIAARVIRGDHAVPARKRPDPFMDLRCAALVMRGWELDYPARTYCENPTRIKLDGDKPEGIEFDPWRERPRCLKPAPPPEPYPPDHKPACGLTSLYRSPAPTRAQHDHHVWAYRYPGRADETRGEWLKRLGKNKSSFKIGDLPPVDRVLALYAEGKRLAPRAAKPRKERTEFRDSEHDPACSWNDGPEPRESIIDSNDDPTDEGYDSATKASGYQFKKLKDGLRRTKVDVDVEERDRTHLRNEVRSDPNKLLRLILGSSDICFSRQKKGKKPAYKVASRHCEDILDRVLVPGGDILVERNGADRYMDVDALRFFRVYVERNVVNLGDRYFLPKRHPRAVPAWTDVDNPVLLPDYTVDDKRQAWPRIKAKIPPGIEVARGPVMWPPEIVLSVMVHGINIGLRDRDREPYFNPPTCLDPIGPRKKNEQKAWIDDLRKRGLTETVDSFYMVGRRRHNTTTERVSLRRTAEPLSELITSFKDAKPVAGPCRIFTAAEREGYCWEAPHPFKREWRERGRLKRWSEAGGCWREFVPASTTPSLLPLLSISSPEMVPLRTWPMPLALPVKCSDLTIGEGDATYVRPGTKTTPAAAMVEFAPHQAVSKWFAMGVFDSEAAKQPCETQSLSERVHIKRGQQQEWSELGAADDEVVEVDKSIKYTSGSVECSHLTIDIGGVCTFKRGLELWNAAT